MVTIVKEEIYVQQGHIISVFKLSLKECIKLLFTRRLYQSSVTIGNSPSFNTVFIDKPMIMNKIINFESAPPFVLEIPDKKSIALDQKYLENERKAGRL